jgi:hypothetical protein
MIVEGDWMIVALIGKKVVQAGDLELVIVRLVEAPRLTPGPA